MTDIQSSVILLDKNSIPGLCEGFLMKKRKYPLQGWHKVSEMMMMMIKSHTAFFYIDVCWSAVPSNRDIIVLRIH